MAATPSFLDKMMFGRAELSTANTARDGSGTLVAPLWMGSGVSGADTAFTAGIPVTGYEVQRIVIGETGDLADCMLTVFTTDGTTVKFFQDFDLSNPAPASATVTGVVLSQVPADWQFPAGCGLLFGLTVAPTSGVAVVSLAGQRL